MAYTYKYPRPAVTADCIEDAAGGIQGIVIYQIWHIPINIQDRLLRLTVS